MVKELRRRYILFRLDTTSPFARRDVVGKIKESVDSQPFSQETRKGLRLILYDPVKRMGVVRCNQRDVDEVRKLLNALGHTELGLQTVRTSGTIKTLQQKFQVDKER